jgi:pimeloyl-ACP methyl ester carboxylesterase
MAKDIGATVAPFAQEFGTGDRRAVALHCTLAHSGAWKGMMAALEEPLGLTALDLPGHGRSPDWDGRADYTALCARAALEAIGEEEVDLIGHSGGAVAALQIALARPDLVRTLTLIEPVLFAAAKGSDAFDEFLALMAPYEAALAAGERMRAAELFTRVWGTGTPWDEIEERSRRYMADRIHLIEAGMPALREDNFGILREGRLEALDLPVMIIIGTECPAVIPHIAEAIAGRLPDVGLAEVPGAGHLLPVTHAAQVAGLLGVNLSRD